MFGAHFSKDYNSYRLFKRDWFFSLLKMLNTPINLKLLLLLDPLEQFEISYFDCVFFTDFQQHLLIIFFTIFLFLCCNDKLPKQDVPKSNLVLFREETFKLIVTIIQENLNSKLTFFFPIIYLSFLVLFLGNLIGMIPYSFTITSSAAFTFFFSVTFSVGIAVVGYGAHSDKLFQLLLPAGVPLFMAPFLILVETISYAARVFSLAIRLFANMLSGHGLLKILASFVWPIVSHSGVYPLYIFPLAIVVVVTLLEIALAFLQAYVFIVLVCIYLNDVINIH
jgi:ATP synthase subunit 6